LVGRKLLAV